MSLTDLNQAENTFPARFFRLFRTPAFFRINAAGEKEERTMDPHETNNGRFLLRLGSKSSGWAVLLLLLLLSSYSAHADHQITGIAIASNGHVYVWFADGKVTDGVRENFEVHKHAYPYTLPAER